MRNQLIFILFLVLAFNCFSQEPQDRQSISIGVYGIVLPKKYGTKIYTGALLDVSLKNFKRLSSSTSVNYSGIHYQSYRYDIFSLTSGLSWKLQKSKFCFRPGIQLGYNYTTKQSSQSYILNALILRSSIEITYQIKQFELGFQFNGGFTYGIIQYQDDIMFPKNITHYQYNLMFGYGIELKYTFGK